MLLMQSDTKKMNEDSWLPHSRPPRVDFAGRSGRFPDLPGLRYVERKPGVVCNPARCARHRVLHRRSRLLATMHGATPGCSVDVGKKGTEKIRVRRHTIVANVSTTAELDPRLHERCARTDRARTARDEVAAPSGNALFV